MMETVMDKLAQFSALIIMLSIGSFALKYFNMEFTLLMWIDSWGPSTGNMIRVAFIVVGVVGLIAGSRFGSDDEEEDG
ncbi:MAG: hypothetical protein ACI81R_003246 [Bradymonadia bacterium]|jgi:hypothetical protein